MKSFSSRRALRKTFVPLMIIACKLALEAHSATSPAWTPAAAAVSPNAVVPRGKTTAPARIGVAKVSDAQLQRVLRIRLQDDPVTRPFAAQAVVQNGRATLGGQTFSEKAREAAQGIAERVPGMVGVQNRIVVKPSADLQIAQQLRSALASDQVIGDANIGVTVLKGKVYLSGTVDSTEQQSRAAQLAQQISGVVTVSNGLTLSAVAKYRTTGPRLPTRTYSSYRSYR